MQEIHNSPKVENRVIEDKIYKIKERALQRTVQMNLEVKRNTEWTMPILIENVLTRKERARAEKQKEIEQKRIAKALRHQLEHQNILSNMGQWLAKRLGTFTKTVKTSQSKPQDINDNLSETTDEETRSKNPIIIPLFNLKKYAGDPNTKFPACDLDRAWMLDQAINKSLATSFKTRYQTPKRKDIPKYYGVDLNNLTQIRME